jgi:hypothetical protein
MIEYMAHVLWQDRQVGGIVPADAYANSYFFIEADRNRRVQRHRDWCEAAHAAQVKFGTPEWDSIRAKFYDVEGSK